MPEKIDDIKLAAIKRDYLKGEKPKAIAGRYEVGEPTVRRYAKKYGWDELLKSSQTITTAAIATVQSGADLDTSQILKSVLESLKTDVVYAPIKSRESAAVAIARLIEVYRKYHPPTIEELVDLALSIPDFDALEFARRLKERIDRTA